MKSKIGYILAAIVLAIGIAGCDRGESSSLNAGDGIYVTMNMEGVYELGYVTGSHSGGMVNADASMLKTGEVFHLIETDQMANTDTQASDVTACTLYAYDIDENVVAAETFLYEEGSGKLNVELTKDGQFIQIDL